jgi:hypothetical protein
MVYSVMTGCRLWKFGSLTFVDVRDICKGVLCVFAKERLAVDGKRFILNATPPMSGMALNNYVKQSHPEVPGATWDMNEMMLNVVMWLGRNIPFLREPLHYNEFYDKYLQQQLSYDNKRSKDVLGIGSYRSMEDTCRDTAESMKPFIASSEDDEKKDEEK